MLRPVIAFFALALGLWVALLACTEEVPPPTPTPPWPRPTLLLELQPPPPDRDLFDVARRLKLGSEPLPPRVVNPGPPTYAEGERRVFWVTDLDRNVHFTTTATLRLATQGLLLYADEQEEVGLEPLKRSAQEFEEKIAPTIRRLFGSEWSPGIDNDPRLTILNARIPGAAGYYSVADEYPRAINPYSNERDMFYMSLEAMRPGTRPYHAVLAHEFQHAVHWNADPTEETWINEGLSELAAELAGYGTSGLVGSFTRRPDIQLTLWPEEPSQSGPHYGAAYLFLKYLIERTGGAENVKRLVAEPADGIAGVDRFLESLGRQERLADFFRDWVATNALGLEGDCRYCYSNLRVQLRPQRTITTTTADEGTVHQFAAAYLELAPAQGTVTFSFTGTTTVRLLPTDPPSGRFLWWSNRGDAINTMLTREFDLTGLTKATLTFRTWYDIEKNYDYAYVAASPDGGRTWQTLPGRHTTLDNPLGNSFGPAFTGKSGSGQQPTWVQEEVDLSPFTGGKVLLRFEYVTDEGVNLEGLALDDIAVPELGFFDNVEQGETGWEAQGFLRTENRVPQYYLLQILYPGKEPVVEEVPVDERGHAQVTVRSLGPSSAEGLGAERPRAIVVIAALAPATAQRASYQYRVSE